MKYTPEGIEFMRDLFVHDEITIFYKTPGDPKLTEKKYEVIRPASEGKYGGRMTDNVEIQVLELGESIPEVIKPFKRPDIVKIGKGSQSRMFDDDTVDKDDLRIQKAFMTKKQRDQLGEGKQVGTLYHGTKSYENAFSILINNYLGDVIERKNDAKHGDKYAPNDGYFTSFSRQFKMANKFGPIVFVIDGDKLSNHHKIIPFNYGKDHNIYKSDFRFEYEERVYGKINNARNYIKQVIIDKTDYRYNTELQQHLEALLKQYGIPYKALHQNKTYNRSIQEGKQVGTLYHLTSIKNLLSILDQDKLVCDKACRVGDDGGISFSRNKEFDYFAMPVWIVTDGDKLSNKYKIQPYDFFGSRNGDGADEFEEKVKTDEIVDLHQYVQRIVIDVVNSKSGQPNDPKAFHKLLYEIYKKAKAFGIKVYLGKKSVPQTELTNNYFNYEIINEGKQVGKLYHATGLHSFIKIKETNVLRSTIKHPKDRKHRDKYAPKAEVCNSFTRNFQMAKSGNSVVLEFDGDKLSDKYKIIPFRYGTHHDSDVENLDENEERIYGPIEDPFKYVKKIYLVTEVVPGIFFRNNAFGERMFKIVKELGIPFEVITNDSPKALPFGKEYLETDEIKPPSFANITEGKQVGELYHVTPLGFALQILKTNNLTSTVPQYAGDHDRQIQSKYAKDDESKYVSFTRNKRGAIQAYKNNGVIFVLDGNKISDHYKIVPTRHPDYEDEFEERIFSPLNDLDKYLKKIIVVIETQPLYTDDGSVNQIKAMSKIAKVPIEFTSHTQEGLKEINHTELTEGKQVGTLYHATFPLNAVDIIRDNVLGGEVNQYLKFDKKLQDKYAKKGSNKYVSFTRNKQFALDMLPVSVVFEVDGDALSNHYKIVPVQHKDYGDEFEERVFEEIDGINKYIKRIIISFNTHLNDPSTKNHFTSLIPFVFGTMFKVEITGKTKDEWMPDLINYQKNVIGGPVSEGKQVGTLYHFLKEITELEDILSSDYLKSDLFLPEYEGADQTADIRFREKYGDKMVSLTRSKKLIHKADFLNSEICLELDGDAISNHYKIMPFNFFSDKYTYRYPTTIYAKDEYEERVIGGIKPIKPYIKKIHVISPMKKLYPSDLDILTGEKIPVFFYNDSRDFLNNKPYSTNPHEVIDLLDIEDEDVITEGKQVGTLYHATKYVRIFSIIQNNELGAEAHYSNDRRLQKKYGKGDPNYVSLTRNIDFAKGGGSIILVIDGDKLSNKYKIVPVTYLDDHKVSRGLPALDMSSQYGNPSYDSVMYNDESEERVFTKIKNIKSYIKQVILYGYPENSKLLPKIIDLLDEHNIPYVIDNNKSQKPIKNGIEESKQKPDNIIYRKYINL